MASNEPSNPGDWQLKLTLLGIGAAFDADLGIANTGALIEIVEDARVLYRYLIDCGSTCGRQLDRLGLTYDDVDGVLLTHTHGDHMNGLENFGYRGCFQCPRTGALYSSSAVLHAAWASLEGKMGRIKVGQNESRTATIKDYFEAHPIGEAGAKLAEGRLHLSMFPVPHLPDFPACGLTLELDPERGTGPVIRWSGDTTFSRDSRLFDDFDAERGDLLFHECSFDPHFQTTVHTHIEDLRELPEELRDSIVLIHHGRIRENPERVSGMTVGQTLQSFRFTPAISKPTRARKASDDRMHRGFADAGL